MLRSLALAAVLVATACAPRVEVVRSDARFAPLSVRGEVGDAVLAAGPSSEFNMFWLLNGDSTKLGVLTSTGASVTNASTGVPFTILTADCPARVFLFQCDAGQANVGAGATCDTTITGANFRRQLANPYDSLWLITSATTICLDAPASTTINCAVSCMK